MLGHGTTWTPGPWEATERSDYHEILARDETCNWYGRPNMHAVAYCDTEIDEGEQLANARLIAAAPDLYSAAERYCRLYLFDEFQDPEFCGISAAQHQVISDLFAALAKARGEPA